VSKKIAVKRWRTAVVTTEEVYCFFLVTVVNMFGLPATPSFAPNVNNVCKIT